MDNKPIIKLELHEYRRNHILRHGPFSSVLEAIEYADKYIKPRKYKFAIVRV